MKTWALTFLPFLPLTLPSSFLILPSEEEKQIHSIVFYPYLKIIDTAAIMRLCFPDKLYFLQYAVKSLWGKRIHLEQFTENLCNFVSGMVTQITPVQIKISVTVKYLLAFVQKQFLDSLLFYTAHDFWAKVSDRLLLRDDWIANLRRRTSPSAKILYYSKVSFPSSRTHSKDKSNSFPEERTGNPDKR